MTLGHGIKHYPRVERRELLGGHRVELRFLYLYREKRYAREKHRKAKKKKGGLSG
jgi:hypothetical protein